MAEGAVINIGEGPTEYMEDTEGKGRAKRGIFGRTLICADFSEGKDSPDRRIGGGGRGMRLARWEFGWSGASRGALQWRACHQLSSRTRPGLRGRPDFMLVWRVYSRM
jgi:hypothetical protein